jgi:hypothetical protein
MKIINVLKEQTYNYLACVGAYSLMYAMNNEQAFGKISLIIISTALGFIVLGSLTKYYMED